MKYPTYGPYGYMQAYHDNRIRNGTHIVRDSSLSDIVSGTFLEQPDELVDIDADAEYIADPENRSIVPAPNDLNSYSHPENVITLDRKRSKAIDKVVSDLKSDFVNILLNVATPVSIAYEEASAEVEAVVAAKYGVEVQVDADVLDYANALIDADVLTKVMSKTGLSKEVQDKVIYDFLNNSFAGVRSSISGRKKSDMLARYQAKLNNLVAEKDHEFAVAKGRK